MVNIEEVCKEVEEFTEDHKGVELAKPLETPTPRPLPPNTTFKWVKSLAIIFIFPLEYGLLEIDGQLRALAALRVRGKWLALRAGMQDSIKLHASI